MGDMIKGCLLLTTIGICNQGSEIGEHHTMANTWGKSSYSRAANSDDRVFSVLIHLRAISLVTQITTMNNWFYPLITIWWFLKIGGPPNYSTITIYSSKPNHSWGPQISEKPP